MSILAKISPLPNLYFLHGFLGDPKDWDEVIKHLPEYHCIALTYPFKMPTDGILIGYSMGGRIALGSTLPKIIISAHPGLQTEEEKTVQAMREKYWLEKLKAVPLPEFLDEWYAQPLFTSLRASPMYSEMLKRRLQQNPQTLINELENHSLVQQSVILRDVFFIHGEYDKSYRDLYERLEIPSIEIPKAGHACHLENAADVARQIKILIASFN
jgi:2-succinyl-6-hydroxy-2,4-cyclohexadiene-1-carboxylate synthase